MSKMDYAAKSILIKEVKDLLNQIVIKSAGVDEDDDFLFHVKNYVESVLEDETKASNYTGYEYYSSYCPYQ